MSKLKTRKRDTHLLTEEFQFSLERVNTIIQEPDEISRKVKFRINASENNKNKVARMKVLKKKLAIWEVKDTIDEKIAEVNKGKIQNLKNRLSKLK